MTEIQLVKEIDLDAFNVRLRSDGIVHVHLKANTLVTVEMQMDMQDAYWEITSVKRPFIFTGDEFVSITYKARKNSKKMEPFVPNIGTAMVVRNLAQRIIADYYYKFDRPGIPYIVVTDFEKGIQWITETFDIPPVEEENLRSSASDSKQTAAWADTMRIKK